MAGLKLGTVVALVVLAGAAGQACAQQRIYTCTDAKGRRITSDRPIAECIDRPQQELNSMGTVRRTIKPTLTAEEQAAEEAKRRKAEEAKRAEEEDKRRNKALLARYPDRASHDRERANALRPVDDAIAAGQKRAADLEAEGKTAVARHAAASDAASKARVKRQQDDIAAQLASQRRLLAERDEEKKRVNAKFDEELGKLRHLWAERGGTAATTAAASSPNKP